jgi:hypothetical protein
MRISLRMRKKAQKSLLAIGASMFLSMGLHAQKAVKIGSIDQLKSKLEASPALSTGRTSLPKVDDLSVQINARKTEEGRQVFIGSIPGADQSTVTLSFSNNTVEGFSVLPQSKKAYRYHSDANGNVYKTKEDINKLLCIEYKGRQETAEISVPSSSEAPPAGSPFYKLESFPGAQAVVLLDFDGEYVSSSYWNGGVPIDAAPATLTEAQATEAWRLISEDFAPFNINITTNDSVFFAAPINRRMRCIFTPTKTAAPTAGGVAYIGSFNWTNDTPCWVFNGGIKGAGEAGSHEIGHTLRLNHDGRTSPSEGYYYGHSGWAPIMGVGYNQPLVQWSKGEYLNANNTEDDLHIIATMNGFTYRTDDAGNTIATAKPLVVDAFGAIAANANKGIISQTDDIDVYSFLANPGALSITVNPNDLHPNLDILLRLTDESGSTLIADNNTSVLSATVSYNITTKGRYYLHIDGTGKGSPTGTGYSDYASLGHYSISGSVQPFLKDPDYAPLLFNKVQYDYYEGSFTQVPNFASLTKVKSGTVSGFYIDSIGTRADNFAVKFYGYVLVPSDGVYTFYTESDDGSNLYIGDHLVVNNDGLHGTLERSGSIGLKQGTHKIQVAYFEATEANVLNVRYSSSTISKQIIPSSVLAYWPSSAAGDQDNDGVLDSLDNCVTVHNPGQEDLDGDGIGDACDSDIDGDGYANDVDCNPTNPLINAPSRWFADLDGDGKGDITSWVDNCTKPSGYVADSSDLCPTDSLKWLPGNCGCGIAETACDSNSIGIQGPLCVQTGISYNYTVNPEGNATGITWWANSNVTVTVNPSNNKNISIVFHQLSGSTTLSAGVNMNESPWYKQYSQDIQIGGCPTNNARVDAIISTPHPFEHSTSVSLESGERIKSVRIINASGIQVYYAEGLNASEIRVGEKLPSGIYTILVESENGISNTRMIKNQ